MNIQPKTNPTTSRPFRYAAIINRWGTALLLVGAVAFLLSNATAFRVNEARILAVWLNPLIIGGVTPNDTHFLVHLPGPELIAFNITMECTALILLTPLAMVCALMLILTRIGLLRALLALIISVTATFILNQFRLGLIAWTTQTWGMDLGYEIGHRFIGSLIALFGFALGFLIFLWITFRPRHSENAGGLRRRSLPDPQRQYRKYHASSESAGCGSIVKE